jgi:hypothetical protein
MYQSDDVLAHFKDLLIFLEAIVQHFAYLDLLTYVIGKMKDNQGCVILMTNLITFSQS